MDFLQAPVLAEIDETCKRAHETMDECVPFLLSHTQQVQPAKKKVLFSKKGRPFNIWSQREKNEMIEKWRWFSGGFLWLRYGTETTISVLSIYS